MVFQPVIVLMKSILAAVVSTLAFAVVAAEREFIWPEGRMPDVQDHQVARMTDEEDSTNRVAYIEWLDKPACPNGGVIIMIPGGSYEHCSDIERVRHLWPDCFGGAGFQLVNLCYRTPRPKDLPIYQSAWEDGQRAVRLVRAQAVRRGFDPERIGVVSMSAGSHLAMLLATSSETPAYAPIDELDQVPCHVNFVIAGALAYGLTTGSAGVPDLNGGVGGELAAEFKFDAKTCPVCLLHGGQDAYSPLASTRVYRQLRRMRIPAELHLYSDCGHVAFWSCNWQESALGFVRQMNLDCRLGDEIPLEARYPSDDARDSARYRREDIWPDGQIPDAMTNQCRPYLEWHFPRNLRTKAVQIVCSGGAYNRNDPDGFEVAPIRRFLNEKGMTVVTLKYRCPNTDRLEKHLRPWQDLQRAIRLVRSEASACGLDPDRIGVMGSSAGGHLTLLGALSSTAAAYAPVDERDRLPCNVNWAVGIYPAYVLTDGVDSTNLSGGNDDGAVTVPELLFDDRSCPMVFVHGDADDYAAMGSVKVWERLREKGVQCDLHTLATREHCFQKAAAEGTGSYLWMNRIWEFLTRKGFSR